MQFVSSTPVAPAADIREACRRVKLTTEETKVLVAVRGKMKRAGQYHAASIPPARAAHFGEISPLQKRLDATAEAFAADPCDKTAAELERAAAAVAAADVAWAAYNDAETHLRIAATEALRPVASALIERGEALLNQELNAARDALAAAPGLVEELKTFDRKIARAKEITDEQRQAAASDPLSWLTTEIGI